MLQEGTAGRCSVAELFILCPQSYISLALFLFLYPRKGDKTQSSVVLLRSHYVLGIIMILGDLMNISRVRDER